MSQKEQGHVFGVRIDNILHTTITKNIDAYLSGDQYHHIVTLNPEILLKARADAHYRDVLNGSDLNIVDGTGVRIALWRRGQSLNSRVTGVDLMHEILAKVDDFSGTVFLATHIEGLSSLQKVKDIFESLYPNITFSGADIDPKNVHKKNIFADVVLCNFGAPEQEFFLNTLCDEQVKIGVGVGGAFDFVTGAVPRASKWMRICGIEWIYRLYKQPHRWKRIYNAVIVFPILSIINTKHNV